MRFLNKGSILKNIVLGNFCGVLTRALENYTFRSLRNSFIPVGLDFMPPDQNVNTSLNGLRRRVATHHENLTRPRMNETLIALNS
jgi:hypothetical protein